MQTANSISRPLDAPRLQTGWLLLVLGALVALCYGAGLRDFFLSDDFCTLGQHTFGPSLSVNLGLAGERITFIRPLTELSWLLNLKLCGHDPLGYHLLNCAFHLANAVLVAQLTFALGRSLALSDELLVREIEGRLDRGGCCFQTVIEGIVTSRQFLNKRGREQQMADGR